MQDQWRPFGVHGNTVDASAVELFTDIKVPDRCFAKRAAVLENFLSHFETNVFAVPIDLVFIDNRQHPVYQLAGWRIVNVALSGRKHTDTQRLERHHNKGIFHAVTSEPAQHVDTDILDVGMRSYVGDHLLEVFALGNGLAAFARIDEFLDIDTANFFFAAFAGNPLRWYGYTLRVIVGIDLSG